MTTPPPERAAAPLSFDAPALTPDAAPAPAPCAQCRRPIADEYFELAGLVVCRGCKGALEQGRERGTSAGRFSRAALFGLGAAAVGAAGYFALLAILEINVGIFAIAVGWLVGRAVHRGSNGAGGRRYQLLAVALTWLAIDATYVGLVAKEIGTDWPAALVAQVLVLPVVLKLQQMPMGLIGLAIFFFGLQQAWRMNGAVPLTFRGPFKVGARRDDPPAAPDVGLAASGA